MGTEMKARRNYRKNARMYVAQFWPRKKNQFITKRRKTLADLYKKPSYRQRVQQYVLKNVLSILTRVKQNVMIKFEPIKECQPEIKNETIPTMISSLSPIRRVKQEVEHKGNFITKPRLATWSAWDRVDHDLRIEVTRLSTLSASRIKNEYDSMYDADLTGQHAESTPVEVAGPVNYSASSDSGVVSLGMLIYNLIIHTSINLIMT